MKTPRARITVDREMIEYTSSSPTPNESWRFTDANGHEHRYAHGYPTLDFVIDESHECDGSEGFMHHDPHTVIDAAHYECKICRQVIEPKMDPPFMIKHMPGAISAQIAGLRDDGLFVTAELSPNEIEAYTAAPPTEETVLRLLNSLPLDRCTSIEQRRVRSDT